MRMGGRCCIRTPRCMDYQKAVVDPTRQVAPRSTLRGFLDDYGDLRTDVLLLAGDVHQPYKPGALRFTTAEARDLYTRIVLYHLHMTDQVYALAETLADRMKEKTGGRMWLAAHARRTDFLKIHWAMEYSIETHLSRIKHHLATGRAVLHSLHTQELKTYAVPDVAPDFTITQLPPPRATDPFFLATDERGRANMTYLRAHGAVLVGELLTRADRRTFGWPLLFTDVLGLVEQALLARAGYVYAHALTAFAGGVVNMRAAAGMDPRTAFSD